MKILVSILLIPFCCAALGINGVLPPPVTITENGIVVVSSETSTTTLATNNDAIFYQTNLANAVYLKKYLVSPFPSGWESSDTNIVYFLDNQIFLVTTGRATLNLTFGLLNKPRFNKAYTYTPTYSTGTVTNRAFVTNLVGSLAHQISTNIFSRMTGTASDRRRLFNTRSVSTTNYVRNPGCYLSDVVGLESYIAGNNTGAFNMNGTLISPRHIVSVAHIGAQLGQTVFFVNRTNNQVYARVVQATRSIGGDFTLGLLNAPLPSDIVPAAIITNHFTYLPGYVPVLGGNTGAGKVPCFMFNQDLNPAVHWLIDVFGGTFSTRKMDEAAQWTQQLRGGDSGSPCATIINGRFVLIGPWTSISNGQCGWFYGETIQDTMNSLCATAGFTNEVLTVLDLSTFTSY